jgi:hypothetical protein
MPMSGGSGGFAGGVGLLDAENLPLLGRSDF